MISKKEYLQDPCRTASVPYWKAIQICMPEDMKILHEDNFSFNMLEQYRDARYFRLLHPLRSVSAVAVPDGYLLSRGTPEEFAAHIQQCYGNGMTPEQIRSYTKRNVYCEELWLVLRSAQTGEIAATGIGELDREIGEGILEWIQVSENCRGRGLGSFLVRELLWRMKDRAKFATVSGQCENPANPEGMYRKCGFVGNDVWHILRKRTAGGKNFPAKTCRNEECLI
mgnify:CR=1 FL=1